MRNLEEGEASVGDKFLSSCHSFGSEGSFIIIELGALSLKLALFLLTNVCNDFTVNMSWKILKSLMAMRNLFFSYKNNSEEYPK